MVGHPLGGVVGFLRLFEQDARFQAGAVLLADPGEFEFWVALGHDFANVRKWWIQIGQRAVTSTGTGVGMPILAATGVYKSIFSSGVVIDTTKA